MFSPHKCFDWKLWYLDFWVGEVIILDLTFFLSRSPFHEIYLTYSHFIAFRWCGSGLHDAAAAAANPSLFPSMQAAAAAARAAGAGAAAGSEEEGTKNFPFLWEVRSSSSSIFWFSLVWCSPCCLIRFEFVLVQDVLPG